MWQLRCIATWGRPLPRQAFSTYRLPHQVWCRSTYPFLS